MCFVCEWITFNNYNWAKTKMYFPTNSVPHVCTVLCIVYEWIERNLIWVKMIFLASDDTPCCHLYQILKKTHITDSSDAAVNNVLCSISSLNHKDLSEFKRKTGVSARWQHNLPVCAKRLLQWRWPICSWQRFELASNSNGSIWQLDTRNLLGISETSPVSPINSIIVVILGDQEQHVRGIHSD